jgi:hypothetical protein
LVLRHQMPVWNYFVNSFYSVGGGGQEEEKGRGKKGKEGKMNKKRLYKEITFNLCVLQIAS